MALGDWNKPQILCMSLQHGYSDSVALMIIPWTNLTQLTINKIPHVHELPQRDVSRYVRYTPNQFWRVGRREAARYTASMSVSIFKLIVSFPVVWIKMLYSLILFSTLLSHSTDINLIDPSFWKGSNFQGNTATTLHTRDILHLRFHNYPTSSRSFDGTNDYISVWYVISHLVH